MAGNSSAKGIRKATRIIPRRSLDGAKSRVGLVSDVLTQRQGSPITFGVEIEAILVFEEPQLQNVLNKYYKGVPVIVKELSYNDHFAFVDKPDLFYSCRELYPSWVLDVPNNRTLDPTLELVAGETRNIPGQSRTLRKYLAEPLIIAKDVLEQGSQLCTDIRAELRPTNHIITLGDFEPADSIILRAPTTDTSKWTLTTDHTLIGLTNSQLRDAIGDECVTVSVSDANRSSIGPGEPDWDSAGIELISPIFKFSEKSDAYTTISKYLSTLDAGNGVRLLPSVWASLQVHIGLDFDKPENAPKLLLQHLAYILICQEDLISKLHPRSHCGLPLDKMVPLHEPEGFSDIQDSFGPNAPFPEPPTVTEIRLEDDLVVSRVENDHTGSTETRSNRRYFMHNLRSTLARPPQLTDIRDSIFNPDQSVPELIALLQKPAMNGDPMNRNRGYMYNFNNITTMFVGSTWKTPKPTIEFRQHACSIDPVEVKMWVEFCLALVNLAKRMAEGTLHQSSGLPANDEVKSSSSRRLRSAAGAAAERHYRFAAGEGRKYSSLDGQQWPCNSISLFLGPGFLDVDEEAMRYWLARYEKCKDDRPRPEDVDESEESQRKEFGV